MYVEDTNIIDLFFAEDGLFEKEGLFRIKGLDDFPSKNRNDNHRYQHCYCRLRGNLLLLVEIDPIQLSSTGDIFTSAKSAIYSIILNNFIIKLTEKTSSADSLTQKNPHEFCLILNFKNKPNIEQYFVACDSIEERDEWIKNIHLSSIKYLRSLRKALSDDLKRYESFEDRPMILDPDSHSAISIKCDNVSIPLNTTSPSFMVKVFCRHNFQDRWQYLGCTDTVQSRSPRFSNTILIPKQFLSTSGELKFELNNVFEKRLDIIHLIAIGFFKINNERSSKTGPIQLKNLINNQTIGTLEFKIIINDDCAKENRKFSSLNNLIENKNGVKMCSNRLSDPNISEHYGQSLECSSGLFNRPIRKTFTFNINDSHFIIEELMQDTELVFTISQTLLQSYLRDEQYLLNCLENQSPMLSNINMFKILAGFHQNSIASIERNQTELSLFKSIHTFRPSRCKKESFLQIVPINFHRQTVLVHHAGKCASRRIYSVGAYACHYFGFQKYNWKSFFSERDSTNVDKTWRIYQKLYKICHNEPKIVNHLQELDDELSKDQTTMDTIKIQAVYNKVKMICKELINLFPQEDVETELNQLNSMTNGINYSEEMEPIDLIYLNINACFVAIDDKIEKRKFNLKEFEPCNKKLKNGIISLRKTILACYLNKFAQLDSKEIEFYQKILFRNFALICQALTMLIIFILDHLDDELFLENVFKTKNILLLHQTLLSCFSEENGMLEDMIYALETVSKNTVVAFNFQQAQMKDDRLPEIDFDSDQTHLSFRVKFPDKIELRKMIESLGGRFECKVTSLMFNIGINQQASLPNNIFKRSLQEELNENNFNKLKAYVSDHFLDDHVALGLVNKLENEIRISKPKNITILELAGELVLHLQGIKAICCKSAKDRSSMFVTLEEAKFVFKFLQLNQHHHPELFQKILDTLRRDGTRIENVHKNIGTRKYAFNYIYLLTFPNDLRPPHGTYSNVDT